VPVATRKAAEKTNCEVRIFQMIGIRVAP